MEFCFHCIELHCIEQYRYSIQFTSSHKTFQLFLLELFPWCKGRASSSRLSATLYEQDSSHVTLFHFLILQKRCKDCNIHYCLVFV